MDRTGRLLKVHDWTIYLDVIADDETVSIDCVTNQLEGVTFDMGETFSPRKYLKSYPVERYDDSGRTRWRFQPRQQTWGMLMVVIRLTGVKGLTLTVDYSVRPENHESHIRHFAESEIPAVAIFQKKVESTLPNLKFGLELEFPSTTKQENDMYTNLFALCDSSILNNQIKDWNSTDCFDVSVSHVFGY